jgi:hypothetical protein
MMMRTAWTMALVMTIPWMQGCGGCGAERGGDADGEGVADPVGDDGRDTPDLPADETPDADVGEEGPPCPSMLLCGEPAVCCAVGEECVEGRCLPACGSGVRCGPSLETCCADEQVCIAGECETPAGSCTDSYDCNEGWYCEPVLGRCVPQPDVACEVRPDTLAFDVALEWEWTGYSADDTYHQVSSTPAVADLDGDTVPEVGFVAYVDGYTSGMIVVLNGADGTEKTVIPASAYNVDGRWGIAFGQIDADDAIEIVSAVKGQGLAAWENDGTWKWTATGGSLETLSTDLPFAVHPYPGVADFEGDGAAEVYIGGVVVDGATGTVKADAGWLGCNTFSATQVFCATTAADLDEDGALELVGGNAAYEIDGSALWSFPSDDDGFPAVGDLDLDGDPDVVVASNGSVIVREGADGTVIFGPVAIPGGGRGGPPTIGDFDGDGRPEMSAAGQGFYTLYDLDCRGTPDPTRCATERTDGILWTRPTQDISSSVTGSSLFDFNGDGQVEVVYNDECHLYVYDGATGDELMSTLNSSRTAMENPIVVDADGDNNSEFVVVANDDGAVRDGCPLPAQHGVKCYGDPSDRWVRTRRVWNEHAYHVTNIGADGSTPSPEARNWETAGLNNFRQNVQGEGVFNAPDLVVDLEVDLSPCPDGAVLVAVVRNMGSLGVAAGIPVSFYWGSPASPGALIATAATTGALLPGGSERVYVEVDFPTDPPPPYDFFVAVDDAGDGTSTETECLEDNNTAAVTGVDCEIVI